VKDWPAAARNWNRPLSRFPLRGQAGGTAASAALRLGQSAGPRQNANQRSGPERKKGMLLIGGYAGPQTPALGDRDRGTLCCKADNSLANKTGQLDMLPTAEKIGKIPVREHPGTPRRTILFGGWAILCRNACLARFPRQRRAASLRGMALASLNSLPKSLYLSTSTMDCCSEPSSRRTCSISSGAGAATVAHRLPQRQPTSITSSPGLGIRNGQKRDRLPACDHLAAWAERNVQFGTAITSELERRGVIADSMWLFTGFKSRYLIKETPAGSLSPVPAESEALRRGPRRLHAITASRGTNYWVKWPTIACQRFSVILSAVSVFATESRCSQSAQMCYCTWLDSL
jgi:hypothetical protein